MNAAKTVKTFFTSKHLAFIFRVYLGGIFIYASMYKIQYPAVFAETIANYQIVPYALVNVMAVVMPWVELACGVLTVIGVRSRSALTIIAAMLAMFTVALIYVLAAEIPIGCGCFHSQEDEATWATVGRDLIWMGMALHALAYDKGWSLEDRFTLKIVELNQ